MQRPLASKRALPWKHRSYRPSRLSTSPSYLRPLRLYLPARRPRHQLTNRRYPRSRSPLAPRNPRQRRPNLPRTRNARFASSREWTPFSTSVDTPVVALNVQTGSGVRLAQYVAISSLTSSRCSNHERFLKCVHTHYFYFYYSIDQTFLYYSSPVWIFMKYNDKLYIIYTLHWLADNRHLYKYTICQFI